MSSLCQTPSTQVQVHERVVVSLHRASHSRREGSLGFLWNAQQERIFYEEFPLSFSSLNFSAVFQAACLGPWQFEAHAHASPEMRRLAEAGLWCDGMLRETETALFSLPESLSPSAVALVFLSGGRRWQEISGSLQPSRRAMASFYPLLAPCQTLKIPKKLGFLRYCTPLDWPGDSRRIIIPVKGGCQSA